MRMAADGFGPLDQEGSVSRYPMPRTVRSRSARSGGAGSGRRRPPRSNRGRSRTPIPGRGAAPGRAPAPGVRQERLEEGELAGGELHRPAPDARPGGPEVQSEVSVGERHGVLGGGRGAEAQQHPGQEFLEAERLGHVVVRPALQPGDGVVHRGAGGEDDDGRAGARGTHASQQPRSRRCRAVRCRGPRGPYPPVRAWPRPSAPVDTVVGRWPGSAAPGDEGRDPGLVLDHQMFAMSVLPSLPL